MTEPEQPAQQPAQAAAPNTLSPEELAARTLALHTQSHVRETLKGLEHRPGLMPLRHRGAFGT